MFKSPRLYDDSGNLKPHVQLAAVLALEYVSDDLNNRLKVQKMLGLGKDPNAARAFRIMMAAYGRPHLQGSQMSNEEVDDFNRLLVVVHNQSIRNVQILIDEENELEELQGGDHVPAWISTLDSFEDMLRASRILSGEADSDPLEDLPSTDHDLPEDA